MPTILVRQDLIVMTYLLSKGRIGVGDIILHRNCDETLADTAIANHLY